MLIVVFTVTSTIANKNVACILKKIYHTDEIESPIACEIHRTNFQGREDFIISVDETRINDLAYKNSEEELHNSVDPLSLVTVFKFESSKISTIPNQIFRKLMWLQNFIASGVQMHNINSLSFNNAANLLTIMLNDNRITTINSYTFVHTKKLKILDLSNNEISYIHESAFNSLKNLERLGLSYNNLKSLDDATFNPLQSIEWIWLDHNRLTMLQSNLFEEDNKMLVGVDISNNEIISISPYIFDNLDKLLFLDLSRNNCIDKNFKNHGIQDNTSIKFELHHCHRAYRNDIPDEPMRNYTRRLEETVKSADSCFVETELLHQQLEKVRKETQTLLK